MYFELPEMVHFVEVVLDHTVRFDRRRRSRRHALTDILDYRILCGSRVNGSVWRQFI